MLLGVVEGLTEFLPISSTGHLILFGDLLDFNDEKGRLFEIVIQTGAILAVCWEYRARLWGVAAGLRQRNPASWRFAANLMLAFLPAAVLGLMFGEAITTYLFQPVPVALTLIVGGLFILWAETRLHQVKVHEVEAMTWRDALKVGLAQSLALIPGTSRSGASIIGGLFFGFSRRAAAEFSFFLAIPTLTAASLYDLFRHRDLLHVDDLGLFAVGSVTAFLSALLAVRGLLRFISAHDFRIFGWYRIVFGGGVLLTAYTGLVDWGVG